MGMRAAQLWRVGGRRRARVPRAVLALFVAAWACDAAGAPQLPAPLELAAPTAGVKERFARVADEELTDAALDQILLTRVAEVASKHGEASLAHAEAELEASLVLCERSRCDLALPYLAGRLARVEALLGTQHRETAMALADLAVARREAPGVDGKPDAEAEALYRRALAIRRQVLGASHEETAGSELFLARELLRDGRRDAQSIREAKDLAARALASFEVLREFPHADLLSALEAAGHVALLEGDYARAEALLRRVAELPTDDMALLGLTTEARQIYADALRGLGRGEEAARLEAKWQSAARDEVMRLIEELLGEGAE